MGMSIKEELRGMSGKDFFMKYKDLMFEDNEQYCALMDEWRMVNNVPEQQEEVRVAPPPDPNRFKVRSKFNIRKPIWYGQHKTPSVGLAEDKMLERELEIEILYEDKAGNRIYPGTYIITSEEAVQYPVQHWSGHKLRIIPINDLRRP